MNTLQVLEAVKETFVDKEHWTQGTNARNSEGNPVGIEDPCAVKFCLVGAICKATGNGKERVDALNYLEKRIDAYSVAYFNDRNCYTRIMHCLDSAITNLKQ